MASNSPNPSVGTWRRNAMLAIGIGSLALLSGCNKKAEGQVVAVVHGDEITSQEVNAELPNAPKAEGEEGKKLQNIALARVIDRTLLADMAKKDGIETSPEYILRKKKMDETLLVQMLGEKLARDQKQPSAQDIQKVMAENPQVFADRTLFALDQIVFPTPDRKEVMQALAPTKTMDEVVAVLNRFGIKFQRGNNQIDSANLSPQMFSEFQKVGTSEPIIIPTGATVVVGKILLTKKVPVTGNEARQVAINLYTKQAVSKTIEKRLEQAKKDANIQYQSGFGPPEKPVSALPELTGGEGAAKGLPRAGVPSPAAAK